jgi:hypothetical protein
LAYVAGEQFQVICEVSNFSPNAVKRSVNLDLNEGRKTVELEMPPWGAASAIFPEAFSELKRSGVLDLTGVLLLTDGSQIAEASAREAGLLARAREVPVCCVPLGFKSEERDIEAQALREQWRMRSAPKWAYLPGLEPKFYGTA